MTTVVPAGQVQSRKLKKEQVRYLALEGGGGKGFAYLGAAAALEELGVMKQVRGFGGASAGAIFSLLLSLGYTSERMQKFMEATDFGRFFDAPTPRLRPIAGRRYERVEDSLDEKELLELLDDFPSYAAFAATVLRTANPASGLLMDLLSYLLIGQFDGVVAWMKEHEGKPPFNLLFSHWKRYLAYMERDMGLFAGEYARNLFHEEIVKGMKASGIAVPVNLNELTGITFEQHLYYFKKELLITGTNLSTGRTQLFSARTTPQFPVADAVRISMSLPFIYKPYVITEDRQGWPECGTYVDGGVWNNIPFREFDGDPSEGASPNGSSASAARVRRRSQPQTLGLRLEFDPSEPVRTFGEFARRYVQFGLTGGGESQVLSKYVDQMIHLDTDGLDLINFTPEKAGRDRAIKRARRTTYRYFDVPPPPDALDPEDDARSKQRYDRTKPCREEAIRPLTPFTR